MCEGYERALGFLIGTTIEQHFSARNRCADMTAFVKAYPQFLGIALDEATGKGKVYFYDGNRPMNEGQHDYEAFRPELCMI